MRVASVQFDAGDRSKAKNWARAEALVDGITGADLVLLPEIWNVGYFSFDRYAAEAEPLDGETVGRLRALARRQRCHLFGGSFVEKSDRGFHNTSVLFDPAGELLAVYRKMHLFGFTSEEAKLLTPGDEVVTAKTALGCVGISTCYDLRFPELYRKQAMAGAELFLVASGWPYPRVEAWQILNRARSIENQVFLASSNCVNANRGWQFAGHSMVVDPWASSSPAAATKSAWSRPTSTWQPSPARGACSPPSPTAGCPSDGSRFLARPARLSRRGSRAIRGN